MIATCHYSPYIESRNMSVASMWRAKGDACFTPRT